MPFWDFQRKVNDVVLFVESYANNPELASFLVKVNVTVLKLVAKVVKVPSLCNPEFFQWRFLRFYVIISNFYFFNSSLKMRHFLVVLVQGFNVDQMNAEISISNQEEIIFHMHYLHNLLIS